VKLCTLKTAFWSFYRIEKLRFWQSASKCYRDLLHWRLCLTAERAGQQLLHESIWKSL